VEKATGVSAFPSLYDGFVAALAAGIAAYFIHRKVTQCKTATMSCELKEIAQPKGL